MRKYTPVEWQAFSQKKDVEKISDALKKQNKFQMSAFVEIALVVMGAALSNIITDDKGQARIWTVVLVLSCFVVSVPFILLIKEKLEQNQKENNPLTAKEMIDCFDNEICYYVMMSDSYYSMYKERKDEQNNEADADGLEKDVLEFYYIETSYYLNKAIMCLQPIYNMHPKVISQNESDIMAKRLVSQARFQNVCNIIRKLYVQLEKETIETDPSIKGMNERYYSVFEDILKMIGDRQNEMNTGMKNTSNSDH